MPDSSQDPVEEAEQLEIDRADYQRVRTILRSTRFFIVLGSIYLVSAILFGSSFLLPLTGLAVLIAIVELVRRGRHIRPPK